MLLDISESMEWSRGRASPPSSGSQAPAAAISLLIRQGDIVGLIAFHERIVRQTSARGGKVHWRLLLQHLHSLEGGGRTDSESALKNVAMRSSGRGW